MRGRENDSNGLHRIEVTHNKRVNISLDNVNGVGPNVTASLGFRVGDTNN